MFGFRIEPGALRWTDTVVCMNHNHRPVVMMEYPYKNKPLPCLNPAAKGLCLWRQVAAKGYF